MCICTSYLTLDFWSSTMLDGVRWTISTSPKYLMEAKVAGENTAEDLPEEVSVEAHVELAIVVKSKAKTLLN